MRKIFFTVLGVCLFLSAGLPVLAQQTQPGPPRVLEIEREIVKPGKGAAHERLETGWPKAFAKANAPVYYIGMTSVTGPGEAWFITGFESFAQFENANKETQKNELLTAETNRLSEADGELLSGFRTMLAVYRDDLSYRTGGRNIGSMRYFSVTTVRVRPGHGNDFEEARKLINAAHEKANVDEHWAVFQVVSGGYGGTYLIFSAHKSMADADAYPQLHGQTYRDAMGEANRDKVRDLYGSSVIFSESQLFAFNPKISRAPQDIVAADPDFWTPKQ